MILIKKLRLGAIKEYKLVNKNDISIIIYPMGVLLKKLILRIKMEMLKISYLIINQIINI